MFTWPQDAQVLAALAIRELIFHLLSGPDGAAIQQLVHAGTHSHRIAQVVKQLQASLDDDIDIGARQASGHELRDVLQGFANQKL